MDFRRPGASGPFSGARRESNLSQTLMIPVTQGCDRKLTIGGDLLSFRAGGCARAQRYRRVPMVKDQRIYAKIIQPDPLGQKL